MLCPWVGCGTIHPMTTPHQPQTGDFYAFRETGNVAKLGAPCEGGFNARYTDGPSHGQAVTLSVEFLVKHGVLV